MQACISRLFHTPRSRVKKLTDMSGNTNKILEAHYKAARFWTAKAREAVIFL